MSEEPPKVISDPKVNIAQGKILGQNGQPANPVPVAVPPSIREQLLARRRFLEQAIDKINHVIRILEKYPECEDAMNTLSSLNQSR